MYTTAAVQIKTQTRLDACDLICSFVQANPAAGFDVCEASLKN